MKIGAGGPAATGPTGAGSDEASKPSEPAHTTNLTFEKTIGAAPRSNVGWLFIRLPDNRRFDFVTLPFGANEPLVFPTSGTA